MPGTKTAKNRICPNKNFERYTFISTGTDCIPALFIPVNTFTNKLKKSGSAIIYIYIQGDDLSFAPNAKLLSFCVEHKGLLKQH